MQKIIKIKDQEFINYIESLHYEVEARKEIISFMISKNMEMNTSMYEKYNKEYMEFYIQYNEAKNKVEEIYIYPEVKNPAKWNLNFKTSELIINY